MKILLVQTSFLGDTVLSTPLIAGIKKLYPHSELWMMTTPASRPLIENDPLLAGVIEYDKKADRGLFGLLKKAQQLKKMDFQIAYSLHKSYRSALLLWLAGIKKRIGFDSAGFSFLYHLKVVRPMEQHDVIRNLTLLTAESGAGTAPQELESLFDTSLRLFVDESISLPEKMQQILQTKKNFAVFFPGSAWKTKMWNWLGYQELATTLLKEGFEVVLLGGPSESDVCKKVACLENVHNFAGEVSMAQSMRIVKLASLVVCNDSMALHLASAFKVPNVSIFCATSPAFGFGPWNNRAEVVERQGLACKPCRRHGGRYCPTGTEACMLEVTSAQVAQAVKRVLGELPKLKVIS